jgi:hypothetical protein
MRSALKASQDFDVCRQPCHILIQIKLALFKELWRISTLPQRTKAHARAHASTLKSASTGNEPSARRACIFIRQEYLIRAFMN